VFAVDVIVIDCFQDRFPAFRFDLPAGARAAIVVGCHLREDAVAQAERRIAKTFEMQAVQQFLKNGRTGNNDLSSPRPDAFDLAPLLHRQASESFGDPAHFSA
jgi:creatinine amidohydrolase/Fe(II)-dependent formamide hydrolase-like protein